jgi:hypothetical protein
MTIVQKLIYIGSDGYQSVTQNGDITNIGGTISSTFTVGGKALLFADGTNSGGTGSSTSGLNFQTVYNATSDTNNQASFILSPGKDFIIYDSTSAHLFSVQSTSGNVTVTGNLTVLGTAIFSNSSTDIADHWTISPALATQTALFIQPPAGITPSIDIVDIAIANGASPVFKINATGTTILKTLQVSGNITVAGTINGVDIVALSNEVYDHINVISYPKHLASEISITPITDIPGVNNVQDALGQIATQVSTLITQVNNVTSGEAKGFEYVQSNPASNWTIYHNMNTTRIQFTLYDSNGNWFLPNSFKIVDNMSVQVTFGVQTTGTIILMLF